MQLSQALGFAVRISGIITDKQFSTGRRWFVIEQTLIPPPSRILRTSIRQHQHLTNFFDGNFKGFRIVFSPF